MPPAPHAAFHFACLYCKLEAYDVRVLSLSILYRQRGVVLEAIVVQVDVVVMSPLFCLLLAELRTYLRIYLAAEA